MIRTLIWRYLPCLHYLPLSVSGSWELLFTIDNISLDQVGSHDEYNLVSQYETGTTINDDELESPFLQFNSNTRYYEPEQFNAIVTEDIIVIFPLKLS